MARIARRRLLKLSGSGAVAAQTGGKGGGHAELTAFGRDLVARYRTIEREAGAAVAKQLAALNAELVDPA